MAQHWCKVASNLDSHPKIRKAGRLGREIFLFALRRNAEPGNPVPGQIPKDELEPWYVADLLQMGSDEAVTGVTAAVTAGLLVKQGDCYVIVSWKDGWGKDNGSGAERTRKWRENKKVDGCDNTRDTRDVTNVTRDRCDIDKTRLDKTIKSPDERDVSLAGLLVLKIITNHPGSRLAKLPGNEKTKRLNKWADQIRLMREGDGHTEDEIKNVIQWCQSHEFWRKQILSADKLREKWDQLVAQMGAKASRPNPAKAAEQPSLVFMVNGVEVSR